VNILKFFFTGRLSFIVFVLLAFVATMLYDGWDNRHQTPIVVHRNAAAQTR
jgi:hypothetical protein